MGNNSTKLRRWPNPVVLTVIAGVTVLVGATSFFAGYLLRSNDQKVIDNSQRQILVTAKTAERAPQIPSFPGRVSPSQTVHVSAFLPAGAKAIVLTTAAKKIGDPLNEGDLVAEIDAEPVFALKLTTPMYRDLSMGAVGVDVQALNDSLSRLGYRHVSPGNKFDRATQQALGELFKSAGYKPSPAPAGSQLQMQNVLALPADGMTVTKVAPAGSVLNEGDIVMEAAAAANQVVVRVDVGTVGQLRIGTKATVSGVGNPFAASGTIVQISDFRPIDPKQDDVGAFPGFDVTVGIAANPNVPAPQGQALNVQFEQPRSKSLSVPLTAMRADSKGAFVWVRSRSHFVKTRVTVQGQADGWVYLDKVPGLVAGETVRIAP